MGYQQFISDREIMKMPPVSTSQREPLRDSGSAGTVPAGLRRHTLATGDTAPGDVLQGDEHAVPAQGAWGRRSQKEGAKVRFRS